jgi:hypothetical protein
VAPPGQPADSDDVPRIVACFAVRKRCWRREVFIQLTQNTGHVVLVISMGLSKGPLDFAPVTPHPLRWGPICRSPIRIGGHRGDMAAVQHHMPRHISAGHGDLSAINDERLQRLHIAIAVNPLEDVAHWACILAHEPEITRSSILTGSRRPRGVWVFGLFRATICGAGLGTVGAAVPCTTSICSAGRAGCVGSRSKPGRR